MKISRVTPQQAWHEMAAGNARFVRGGQEHPHQDALRRDQLADGQDPNTALFGCADSRIAAEIIFDRGLGDLFVIRNMGHVVAESIVASLEFAVAELGVALIVVLAHDSCSAVKTAINLSSQNPDELPPAVERTLQPILPAVQQVWYKYNSSTPYVSAEQIDTNQVGRRHLELTVNAILGASVLLRDAVAEGRLGLVGCQYSLTEGHANPVVIVGNITAEGAE
ncbi:MAG: carbonic anhydrase [Microbacteriaceae bacterium]|nr:carbonic anhydrase [Microbacteriaceae bacterium]